MDFIDTFELRFPGLDHGQVADRHLSSTFSRVAPTGRVADVAASAEVNAGRWIVRCPDCHGAERVNITTGLMFCCECRNKMLDHDFRRVLLPEPKERAKIERALLARPEVRNRNWLPHEAAADLAAENQRHGVV